jgi:Lactate racemase N-terminal domain
MGFIADLLDPIPIPRVAGVSQKFDRPRLDDPEDTLKQILNTSGVLESVFPKMEIAIAVGSRGISNQPALVKVIAKTLQEKGARPFLVPAMGSHGGATADGQKKMLEDLGFGEDRIGVPIRSSMETVRVGTSKNSLPVHVDKNAHEADGIVIINRIKPHTSFRGPFESGLMKMITIGLGKQKGAEICHELGIEHMAENFPAIARVAIEKENILFAIGLLENAFHETCRIELLRKEDIETEEPKLQEEAMRLLPKLHFTDIDVLVIDEIGKNISGTGFDTNVVGRYSTPTCSGGPNVTRLVILNLTEETHGNANGLGIADFTTRKLFDQLSFENTYPNALTSTVLPSVKIPMVLKTDLLAIKAAIKTCNMLDKQNVRLIRIKNTNEIERIEVSESMLDEVRGNPYLSIETDLYPLKTSEQDL